MSDRTYVKPKGRACVSHQDARPAVDHTTWDYELDEPLTLRALAHVLERARVDDVPADAHVQVSGLHVYLTWERVVS